MSGVGSTPASSGQANDETIDLAPPQAVLEITLKLESAGFETWCVGGAVRDAFLGVAHADWDLATAARPDDVLRLFPRRTVLVGIAHGTVGVLSPGKVLHEVTTFRRDVRTDGRHAEVEFGASLDEDLARRDFTINSIAYSATHRVLKDPFGGRADLAARVVRAVGVPSDRMKEDRLRALRGLRFASRFGFEIEPATWEAIVASAPALTRLSAERVREELEKTMEQVVRPSRAMKLWRESGAFGVLIPSLGVITDSAAATLDWLPRPSGFTGTPTAAARDEARRLIRLAALFMDHPPPQDSLARTLRDLKFSNADAAWISTLVAVWQSVGAEMQWSLLAESEPAVTRVRRWVAKAGRTRIRSLIRLAAARWSAVREAGGSAPRPVQVGRLLRIALSAAFHDAVEMADLAIDGNDIVDGGIARGPLVGEILRQLLDAVLEDQSLNVRERLMERARVIAAEGKAPGSG